MISFDDALRRVLAAAPRLGTEQCPIREALGRTLAENLVARRPLPPFDYSAMDGYAVDSKELGAEGPYTLPVVGESRAGHPAPVLQRSTSCRIFTGARIPAGADAVILQEDVRRIGDSIRFADRPQSGQNVRFAGEDLPAGGTALEAGTRLDPYRLGLAAALDRADLVVSRRPRVTILCTGDELRPPGSGGNDDAIPESNGVAIAALAETAGALAEAMPSIGDDLDRTIAAIRGALAVSDVLVTVGGVSVGSHDVVKAALEAAGVLLDFWKVAIKPGKPLVLGRSQNTVVLGLPGNPVSAQLTFSLFGLPLLRTMQGDRRAVPRPLRLPLERAVRQQPGRRGFYRAVIEGDHVVPLASQASGATTSLPWADALVVIPEDSTGAEAGEMVTVYRLSDL